MLQAMNTIVIATYNEPLEWMIHLMGKATIVEINKAAWGLPNIGREAYPYLHYIINTYDNLNGSYSFVHGDAPRHWQPQRLDLGGLIKALLRGTDGFESLAWGEYRCMEDGFPHHLGLPVLEFYERLFQQPSPRIFSFVAGASFKVSADYIKLRPKKFYEKALELLLEYTWGAWIIERLLREILDQNVADWRPAYNDAEIVKVINSKADIYYRGTVP